MMNDQTAFRNNDCDELDEACDKSIDAEWNPTGNLTYQINVLDRLIDRQTRNFLATKFGLSTAEWHVLAFLVRNAPEKQNGIAAQTYMFKSQVSRAIGALMCKGLVVREIDPRDKRSPNFTITEKGRQVHKPISRWATRRQKALLAQLTPQQLQEMYSGMQNLTKYLKSQI